MERLASESVPYDRQQTLRFLGISRKDEPSTADLQLIQDCENELLPLLKPKAIYDEFEIKVERDIIDLTFATAHSHKLWLNLKSASGIYLFACTVGFACDQLVNKYKILSPSRSAVLQAVGASATELWCESIADIIGERASVLGRTTLPRFSAGYGDLSLDFQHEIFKVLSPEKHLGITLSSGGLMIPTKSVTAMIGYRYE